MPYPVRMLTGFTHVSLMKDRKTSIFWINGSNFGNAPLHLEAKLEVEDSANFAGVMVDMIRYMRLARDRGPRGLCIPPALFLPSIHPSRFPTWRLWSASGNMWRESENDEACDDNRRRANMPEIRMGVIGCGSIAEIAHFPSIARCKEATLAAVCDTNQDAGKRCCQMGRGELVHRLPGHVRADQMDAVVIATPNNVHRNQAVGAAKAGFHVIVEKPMAVTNTEAGTSSTAASPE